MPLVPNVGVVAGRDAILVIDTGLRPANGAAVFASSAARAGIAILSAFWALAGELGEVVQNRLKDVLTHTGWKNREDVIAFIQ